ncbi:2OG-Fe(II) oxygenase [Poritiphilus flavus]|uniref:Prolyl 4-hydroxylase subunit alpha n=1 Tax=Poritiphilus flavus TaxID=2697053 RepID=A0A6L9EE37_9FLAO|nr:2OG-Fe(II) oxygenase [Poritiphilus flavus]NAS13024.1 prolyl 4-hydroxylase subunit alpha [Poritiphilus flavus]
MIRDKIKALDWNVITEELHSKGYCRVPKVLNSAQCEEIIKYYDQSELFRKTVVMERHRFGKGEYKYFDYPLPKIIQDLRVSLYPGLSTIANDWMKALKIEVEYPNSHQELQRKCAENDQNKPTPLLLKYEEGGFNTLHQDLYGEVYFPIQAVFCLTEPGEDYTGGEFVLTQQVPRAQSKANVLNPQKGDMVLFATNFRPIKGSRGYYRANMKHGVSEVHLGNRWTMGIIFHDATT